MKKTQSKGSNRIIRKIIFSLIICMIGILAYTTVIDAIVNKTAVKGIDEKASRYYNGAINRAIYTYAIVRGINGIISVFQETEIAVSPAGIGINMAVGEILDPINDLVERFSWVMLVSTTSLGIQKILMEIGAWLGFKVLLTFAMIIFLAGVWFPRSSGINFFSIGYKLIIASIIIRFCIPAVAVASNQLYFLFLEQQYNESTQAIEDINKEIKKVEIIREDKIDEKEGNYLKKMKNLYNSTMETIDVRKRINLLKDKLSNYAKYITNLIIVYLLQTIIIPIAMLWLLLKFIGYIGANNFSLAIEQKIRSLVENS